MAANNEALKPRQWRSFHQDYTFKERKVPKSANGGNSTAKMPNIRIGDEFPAKSGIIVAPKFNPSGSRAYRVEISASITGKRREQRQFPTKEEARLYATKRHSEITQFGHAAFTLTSAQRNDATRAIILLSSYCLTLEDAAKLAISHKGPSCLR